MRKGRFTKDTRDGLFAKKAGWHCWLDQQCPPYPKHVPTDLSKQAAGYPILPAQPCLSRECSPFISEVFLNIVPVAQ